ncbi:MAG: PilN domain-containing protein [Planctomycetaceae bacterium]|nr:PilN domain-containing protein [Planctomycetaceae bacterium]
MATINFVPDDYLQQRQSSRANVLYLMMLTAMIGAIGVTFGFIKMRQKAVLSELEQLDLRMKQTQQQLAELEQLEKQRVTMMKTMVTTAELLEPIPRSVLLASLTNNLPSGASLVEFKLQEKEITVARPAAQAPASQYQAKAAAPTKQPSQPTTTVESSLDIRGIAPSDIQVASYIARLSSSILFDQVALVESKEEEIEGLKFRQFRLSAVLKPNLTLSKDDIDSIRKTQQELL